MTCFIYCSSPDFWFHLVVRVGCTLTTEIRVGDKWPLKTEMPCFLQLLSCFDSESARSAAMSDLRHRILPPDFLSKNPQEAGFCLWLLHPEPSSRPTARCGQTLGLGLFSGKKK